MKFSNIHCVLCILWGMISIWTSNGFSVFKWNVSFLSHSHWIHAPSNVESTTYKQMENTVCVKRRYFFFRKGMNPRELLVKMKNEKWNATGINAAERYFYFGNLEVYKVMTAAKDMTFWFYLIWRETTAKGSTRGSQIKCIVWRRRTMQ